MTTYEVHVSRAPGEVEERHVLWAQDPRTGEVVGATTSQSLVLRTPDKDLAERMQETWNRTARRSDDRRAWIREVADT